MESSEAYQIDICNMYTTGVRGNESVLQQELGSVVGNCLPRKLGPSASHTHHHHLAIQNAAIAKLGINFADPIAATLVCFGYLDLEGTVVDDSPDLNIERVFGIRDVVVG
ncbi:hypothetical protein K493DRAFT_47544 [Basidiobolus meristosporus CBS 931.73]|uniref:Uncharacterized protein n=1 Tax=Basidiobolus meristosporus CBS 931.73 TaxID=1314790 RepID=A0A1Y1Y1T3_9FUNG|nr:hypothetical protein K493DRAFT_47544 [Basidiobolus meristosporus CBS 931.73]|eukprot:ORX91938.1 hypothetical protein K493DRAFT_47544 [Basidiobolus meristosporus CBS 931.73]